MKKWVIAVLIGVALLALGSGAANNKDGLIRCGSEIMGPGDVCEESRRGSTVSERTYEEMKASQEAATRTFNSWGRWVLLGGGLFLTAVGIWGIVTRRRRAASAEPTVPATAYQQAPQHQVPQVAQQPMAQQVAQHQVAQQQVAQQQMPRQHVTQQQASQQQPSQQPTPQQPTFHQQVPQQYVPQHGVPQQMPQQQVPQQQTWHQPTQPPGPQQPGQQYPPQSFGPRGTS
jgi:hypothetical protein